MLDHAYRRRVPPPSGSGAEIAPIEFFANVRLCIDEDVLSFEMIGLIRHMRPGNCYLRTGLVSERFGRFERGGARGGVDSGQQTDRAANSWRKQGSERVEHRGPDLIRRDTHHD
jgi:hypothetical protein